MALKDTIQSMHKYLECITKDLKKAYRGNKAASQRVRTCTIKLAKVSKTFRKESVSDERKTTKRKTTKKTRKPAKRVAKRSPKRKKRR